MPIQSKISEGKRFLKSLYIHFPFCLKLCPFCDFYKTTSRPNGNKDFEKYFTESWPLFLKHLNKYGYELGSVDTIYIGGGTPSLWKEGHKFLKKYLIELSSQIKEFTLEVDPGAWEEQSLAGWRDVGVNRLSIGVQTLNSDLLSKLGRSHNTDDTYRLLEYAQREKWNFSTDFLLGLPHSSMKRDLSSELSESLKFGAKHISSYILTVGNDYPLKKFLPDDELIREEFLLADKVLKAEGFNHYEVSSFSLPGYESLHNKNYWSHSAMGAIGGSATGFLPLTSGGVRTKWVPGKEIKFNVEVLNDDELKLEKLYFSLRQSTEFKASDFISELSIDEASLMLKSWQKYGYISEVNENDSFVMEANGLVIVDELMNEIFSFRKK